MDKPELIRTPHSSRLLMALLFAAATSHVAFGTTWIVDAANSPGTNFISINAALNAASPGDTILVKAGVYMEDVVVTFGITIIGWNATTYPMTVPANPFVDVVWGTLLVQGIPANERVLVSGMTFARPTIVGGISLGIFQCNGPVIFDRIIAPNGGFYIGESSDVFLQDVRMRHVPGTDPPVPGVFITNSSVQANDLDSSATDLGGEPNFYASAPHALEAVDGAVVCLARPKLIGGVGGGPWINTPSTPGGGSAIRCSSAVVSVISSGSGLFYLIGGTGGVRGVGSAPGIASGYGGPAVLAENGGLVHLKGAPTPIPGIPGQNLAGGPLGIAPPGSLGISGGIVQTNPQAPATMRFIGATAPGAASFISFQSGGAFYPFSLFFVTTYDLNVFPPSVQFLGGDPFSSIFIISGTTNSARLFTLGLNLPASFAGFDGVSVLCQGADVLGPNYFVSNPISVTLP